MLLVGGMENKLNTFYGLTQNPFLEVHEGGACIFSQDHEGDAKQTELPAKILGIGVFTAPPGMGKTYALRCFAEPLNPNLCEMRYICLIYSELYSVLRSSVYRARSRTF